MELPNCVNTWIDSHIKYLVTFETQYLKLLYEKWPIVKINTFKYPNNTTYHSENIEILYKWSPELFIEPFILASKHLLLDSVRLANIHTIKDIPTIKYLAENYNNLDWNTILTTSLCDDNYYRIEEEWWIDKEELKEIVESGCSLVKSAYKT